jgi:hypothetical protein
MSSYGKIQSLFSKKIMIYDFFLFGRELLSYGIDENKVLLLSDMARNATKSALYSKWHYIPF